MHDQAKRRTSDDLAPALRQGQPLLHRQGMALARTASDEDRVQTPVEQMIRLLLNDGQVEQAVRVEGSVRRSDETVQFQMHEDWS